MVSLHEGSSPEIEHAWKSHLQGVFGELAELVYQDLISSNKKLLVSDGNMDLGIVLYCVDEDALSAMIYLHEKSRGKGFGKQTLSELENLCRKNGYNIFEIRGAEECGIVPYYEKMGFSHTTKGTYFGKVLHVFSKKIVSDTN